MTGKCSPARRGRDAVAEDYSSMPETAEPRETPPGPVVGCPFCALGTLEAPLTETPSFFAVGDHAPLVGGHILIVPKAHYACYGAIPAALDEELLALKETIRRFQSDAYRAPNFFEHGVFRQTVAHAHLHAIPLGPTMLNLEAMAVASGGQRLRSQADLRGWYATRGQYFMLETPADAAENIPARAAIFPPEMGVYGRALTNVRQQANLREGWSPQPLRYATRGPKMKALTEAWQAWSSAQGE
jgi:diadenosine tetraphosphate (Ap4A) HIT family hydrolase